MEMPKPSEAHIRLQCLVGDWSGKEILHPSPWDPAGGVANARVHNVLALDGFTVIQDYEQERNGRVVFRGHGVFTWHQEEHIYVLYWFDSMGFPASHFRGNFDGQVLAVTNKSNFGYNRATFDFSKGSVYDYRMEISQDAKQWNVFMEGTYQRRG